MRFTLISPRIAIQKGDFLGSGIPYWPIELATLAAFLRERGGQVSVFDLFGKDPHQLEDCGDHYLQGAAIGDLLLAPEITGADGIILYAMSYMSHGELLDMARRIRTARPDVPLAILENSQAVTAYSVSSLSTDFFQAGADLLICGEPYFNWDEIESAVRSRGSGVVPENVLAARASGLMPVKRMMRKLARYPVPAWDLFNLEGYWSLPYSHGPKTGRYLPVLTSRGCPYPCDFCVVPETNEQTWRGNAAEDVVNEMIALRNQFNVRHFQLEDLNPTVRHKRIDDICRLLIERQAGVFFYLVSGTKAETVRIDQVPLLAEAGCRYLSISPESGSASVMKAIGKRFDYDHAAELVKACRNHEIRTQACFIVGHPAETEQDHELSRKYLRRLIECGLDEVAIFIVAPLAGSALHARGDMAISDRSALPSFSPKGRENYRDLNRRRAGMIWLFFREKLKQGVALWAQGWRSLFGQPQTKMENLPRRILFILWLIGRYRLKRFVTGQRV